MRPRARTSSPARPSFPTLTATAPRSGSSGARTRLLGAAVASAAGLALALAAPVAAQAHVELEASSTAPAALSVLTFAVGHGCEGSPTTSLAVTFPAEVQAVTPTVKPGWSITEAPAVSAVGAETTDTAETDTSPDTGAATGTTVTWTADPGSALPDGFRDTVAVSALLPVGGAAGDLVAFPTVQTCEAGSYDWVELAQPGSDAEPASPAPVLTLTDASSTGTGSGEDTAATGSQEAAAASSAPSPVDETARALALGALVVGVVGLVLLTTTLRRRAVEAGR